MILEVVLIALALHRPTAAVWPVWIEASIQRVDPKLACAVVEWESGYQRDLLRVYADGTSDYGYGQLNSRWHPQFRDSFPKHVNYTVSFLRTCVLMEGGDPRRGAARYFRWDRLGDRLGVEYGNRVIAIRRRL